MRRSKTGGGKLLLVAVAVAAAGLGGLYTYQSSVDAELGLPRAAPAGELPAVGPVVPLASVVAAPLPLAEAKQVPEVAVPPATQAAAGIVAEPVAGPTTAPGEAAPSTTTVADVRGPVYSPLTAAEQLAQRGDFVGARTAANRLLLSGQLLAADEAAAKAFIAQLNQTLIFSGQRFKDDPLVDVYVVKSGDRVQRVAYDHDITWELMLRINGISDPRRVRVGQSLKVIRGPFYAVVDKSTYTMDVYLGGIPGVKLPKATSPATTASASIGDTAGSTDASVPTVEPTYVGSFKVGLGANDSTPTGLWRVEFGQKLKNPTYFSPRGEGVIAADDPANPLGEFWIGLAGVDGQAVGKTSYGIHGTIEPETIGTQSSLGCIRLVHADIAQVFELLYEVHSMVLVK
jgi:lipoprotein-anchoring transpeptidase ErfK/SrfK